LTSRKLFSIGFGDEIEINTILENMVIQQYLEKGISYKCCHYDVYEKNRVEVFECESCGNNFDDDFENHELEHIYFWSEKLKGVKTEMENKKNDYIMSEYKINHESLISMTNLIPFFGSGLSAPLGIPTWRDLLKTMIEHVIDDKEQFMDFVNTGDIFNALSYLKTDSTSLVTDLDIKKFIYHYIKANLKNKVDNLSHNYIDLVNLGSTYYLTTNYDTSLSKYCTSETDSLSVPLNLDEVDLHLLNNHNTRTVVHLHGIIDKIESMIVTKEDYDTLYDKDAFKQKLSAILSNKTLLFLGFSFNDKYFVDLFNRIISIVGGTHYIVVPNIKKYVAQQWSTNHLKVIGINVLKDENGHLIGSEYVKAIRAVLEPMME
jgi:NAD-dependent SIR2 family protein deacetylase